MTPARRGRRAWTWERLLWGVELVSDRDDPLGPLATGWHKPPPASAYDGEPTRTLAFTTRRKAAEWCRTATAEAARHSPDWRFRVVRVRETTEQLAPARKRGRKGGK